MLNIWWVWLVGGVGLLIVTALLPEPILLGFALGAISIGILMAIGVPLGASIPLTLLVFGLLSFVAWLIMRRWLGVRRGQVRVWTRDINED